MLMNDQALKSLHEIRDHEYCNMTKIIKVDEPLSKDELACLNHPSDFVNTVTDPLRLAFEAWLYQLPSFFLVVSVIATPFPSQRRHADPLSLLRNPYSRTEEREKTESPSSCLPRRCAFCSRLSSYGSTRSYC